MARYQFKNGPILEMQYDPATELTTRVRPPTERDPNGRDAHEPGSKLDDGKPEVASLFLVYFPDAVAAVTEVSAHGARKYTEKGWVAVPDGVRRYTNAMVRHILSELAGEEHDRDSGLLHAAHTAWNAMARLQLVLDQIRHVERTKAAIADEVGRDAA